MLGPILDLLRRRPAMAAGLLCEVAHETRRRALERGRALVAVAGQVPARGLVLRDPVVGDGRPALELAVGARQLQRADEAVQERRVGVGGGAAARAALLVPPAADTTHGMTIPALQSTKR